jgi:hypothetical protein
MLHGVSQNPSIPLDFNVAILLSRRNVFIIKFNFHSVIAIEATFTGYPPARIRTGNFHCIRLEQIFESHSGIRLMKTYPHEPTPPFLT